MSYLNGTRITFSGRFFGDVSTINNRDTNYPPSSTPPTQLWNPGGGSTFDFLDCRVSGGEHLGGAPVAVDDPVRGLAVVGAADRPSAKLVDLDPHWQTSSEIWGLVVRLIDPTSGAEVLSGSFRVSGFRDIASRQIDGADVNNQPAGASFVSVLEDVVYGSAGAASPALAAIRAESSADRLSIVLNTFGFFRAHVGNSFATGSLTGCIGPWRADEPAGFVAGRRIEAGVLSAEEDPPVVLGPTAAALDRPNSRLVVDLGNAYPIVDHAGTPATLARVSGSAETIAALEVGVLSGEDVAPEDVLSGDDVVVIGTIDLTEAPGRAGVFSFPLTAAAVSAAGERPLALLARRPDLTRRVVCRETTDGLYVRADEFVHRLDAHSAGVASVWAVRRGSPAAGVAVHLARSGAALQFPAQVETDARGFASIPLTAGDPGNPRGALALDGVVVGIAYSARLAADGSPDYLGSGLDPSLDLIVAHVRDPFEVPDEPDWARDIQPILAQYARLYPVMREHIADLGDRDAVISWRRAMVFALTRSITDPNYMPVSRDLSAQKLAAIVKWLELSPTQRPVPSASDSPVDDPLGPDPHSAEAAAASRRILTRQAALRRGEPES